MENTSIVQVSDDGGLDWGGNGGKLVSAEVVRNAGCILREEPTTFYGRLDVMFEKMREITFKIFEPKQS